MVSTPRTFKRHPKHGKPLFRDEQPPVKHEGPGVKIPSLAVGTWIVFRGPRGVQMTAEVTKAKSYSVRLVDGTRMQLNARSTVVRVLTFTGVALALHDAMVKSRRHRPADDTPTYGRGKWQADKFPWSAKTWVAWKRPAPQRVQSRWGGKWQDKINERGKIATRMKNEFQIIYEIVDISIWRPGMKFEGYVQVDGERGAHNRMNVIIWDNEMKRNGWVAGKVAYPITVKNNHKNEWIVDDVLDVSLLESEAVA